MARREPRLPRLGDVLLRALSDAASMTDDALATRTPATSPTGWLRPLRWSEPVVPGLPAGGAPSSEFALPVGTVTFLLTDVEGSTLAWQATPEAMGGAIARQYENPRHRRLRPRRRPLHW